MKLFGKWYKRQAEQTKNELRGDFDLSGRENPGRTMMLLNTISFKGVNQVVGDML